MIKKIICLVSFIYSGWCYANPINFEISRVNIPSDLNTVKPFLLFESTNTNNVPVDANDLQNIVDNVATQVSQSLTDQYPNMRILDVENGILKNVVYDGIESNIHTSDINHQFNADLLLYGKLSRFNSFVNYNQLESSGQNSLMYHLDIAIRYRLVRVADKKVLADFIAFAGVGNANIFTEHQHQTYEQYIPALTSDLYDSTYGGITRAIANKDLFATESEQATSE